MDSVADDGFFTYGYLKALERSRSFDVTPVYFSVYNEDGIVAAAPCYIDSKNQTSASEGQSHLARRAVSMASRLGIHPNRVLVCSSPSSYHSKILFGGDCDKRIVLSQICRAIDGICKEQRILFSSFPYVSEFDSFLIENLQSHGYYRFPSVETFYLDIDWSDFEEYLESLQSHKIRSNVRREMKKCVESGVTVREEKEFGDLAATLASLHSNLFSKYNEGLGSPRSTSFFRELSECAKDNVRIFTARRRDDIVGFSMSLQHRDTLDVHVCGFDYNAQMNTDFTYFNVAYYAPIRMAIEEGIKRLHYSIKSERVKLRRGCRMERTYSFVKCHHRVLGLLYGLYTMRKQTPQKRS